MLNIKEFGISFLIFGFMLMEMPHSIKSVGSDSEPERNTGYVSDGLDYDNIDDVYKYNENNEYDRLTYRNDDGYNSADFQQESSSSSNVPPKKYPEFNMKNGKKAVIAMLEDIETNYLYFDSDDEEDNAKRPNFGDINAAQTVDGLISAGNRCLSSDQDDELVGLDTEDRVALRNKLDSFLHSFEKKLEKSGFRDTKGPLTYLRTRLNISLKDDDEEEEDDSG